MIKKWLCKAYPLLEDKGDKWKVIISFSLFIVFFLGVFQPFELSKLGWERRLVLILGYGFITGLCLFIHLFGIAQLLNNKDWKVYKEILWSLWIIVVIGILNYFYTTFANLYPFHFSGMLFFIQIALITSILPVSFLVLFRENQLYKKYAQEAQHINSNLAKTEAVTSERDIFVWSEKTKGELKFQVQKILFLESIGNYVHIHQQQNQVEKIRSTLKGVEKKLTNHSTFFRCHRAFIINLQHISKVSGNAQGLKLKFSNDYPLVPVSRKFIPAFKQLYY